MPSKLSKIAAGLSFIIGAMAVIAGGRVLLGHDPGYYVIDWLLVYNFIAGLVSATLTATLLLLNHHLGRPLALATLGLHSIVLLLLMVAYREVVAPDSMVAMTVRITVWIIISTLLMAHALRQKMPARYKM
jgi:hypothetical protein